MTVVGAMGRLGCANHRERGLCSNARTIQRDVIADRVLEGLKNRLLTSELVETFVSSYVEETNAINRTRSRDVERLRRDLDRTRREMRNLLELMKAGLGRAALVRELQALEDRERREQRAVEDAGKPEQLPEPHPTRSARA